MTIVLPSENTSGGSGGGYWNVVSGNLIPVNNDPLTTYNGTVLDDGSGDMVVVGYLNVGSTYNDVNGNPLISGYSGNTVSVGDIDNGYYIYFDSGDGYVVIYGSSLTVEGTLKTIELQDTYDSANSIILNDGSDNMDLNVYNILSLNVGALEINSLTGYSGNTSAVNTLTFTNGILTGVT